MSVEFKLQHDLEVVVAVQGLNNLQRGGREPEGVPAQVAKIAKIHCPIIGVAHAVPHHLAHHYLRTVTQFVIAISSLQPIICVCTVCPV